jgi:hypothetical protein
MGTLGAVYGISFVAGSLASMGSAYMASNIYKIEDEAPVEVPMEAGMYGGVDPIDNPMYKRPINYEIAVRKAESDKAYEKYKEEVESSKKNKLTAEENRNLRKKWDEKSKEIAEAQLKAKEEAELKAKIEEDARMKAEAERLQQINNEKAQAEKAEAERLLTQAKIKAEAQAKEEADKKYEEAIIRARESELKAEADRKEEKLKEQKEKAFKLAEENSSFFDVISAIELANTEQQTGGSDDNKLLYDIIENGAFSKDGKSVITWDTLQKIKPIIIAFSPKPVTFPDSQTEFDSEMIKINKRRAAKILTVTSWLRKVPNKTNITEKDISDIVPDSLSLKQFIDILSNMTKLDDKKKPTIRINKNTFTKASDVILPSYVLDDTIKILTNKLDDKIEIKDLIKYFQSNGTVYTFFKFKNILRLMYDYTLGEIDTIIIHLSKVMKWLNEIKNSNRITNADIEKFKADNSDKVNILVDTLDFLIKERVLIKSKLIRVSDFNAIETLDPDNLDRNTKIISWLIDPARATLPKPTKEQYMEIIKQLQLPKIEKDMMKVPTLFVGPIELPEEDVKSEGTSITEGDKYIRGVELLQKIEGTIENRGKTIKEFGEKVKGYEKTEREKKSKEFMSKTEKAEKEKLIKDVTEKDRKIKELEQAEKKLKEDDAIKAAAQKTFNERLKKAVEKQNLMGLEALLKERDLQLSKEYETVKKESENKNKGLIKPANLDQAIWDKLLSEIGAIKDPLKLAEYTNKFKTDNPSIDVTPFPDVDKMINAIYSAKQSKENKEKGNNSNSNLKICKNAKVGDKCRDQDNNFNVITKKGGYRQTLRNHLRSSRSSTRRYV